MPHMFFIVKGNGHVAIREAKSRNIDIEVDAVSANGYETYCYAPMFDRPKIIDWYSKGTGMATSEEGDCLWYAVREN